MSDLTEKQTHTPTPLKAAPSHNTDGEVAVWAATEGTQGLTYMSRLFAMVTRDFGMEGAALIVRACNSHAALLALVERYMAMYPAFRIKPEGAPGSQVRDEQERKMALEDSARAALAALAAQVKP